MTTRGPADGTAPCKGWPTWEKPEHAIHCSGCDALATLRAENAELRTEAALEKDVVKLAEERAHRYLAEAASLRERLEEETRIANGAIAVAETQIAAASALRARATAAEGERDQLRELVGSHDVWRGCKLCIEQWLIPLETIVRDYHAAHPGHTEGEASAPPKETTP